MFTIMKGRLYVAMPGSAKSYTSDPDRAVKYRTEEEARKNACGNERVVQMRLCWR